MDVLVLNKKEKLFLLSKRYVTAKTLDAEVYENWHLYFIDNFDWLLDMDTDSYNFNRLCLNHINDNDIVYDVKLILKLEDKQEILDMEKK